MCRRNISMLSFTKPAVPPVSGSMCVKIKATPHSPQQRMERLISQALVPVVQALEATGEINGKLIWSNTGYLINWYLTEMSNCSARRRLNRCAMPSFFEKTLTNGEDNPLWRTVVLRDGLLCAALAASVIAYRMCSNVAIVR